ncbi:MAG: DUF2063 domain-containing protein, partial [Methylococcales bacterium]|nr:DUF2063 domain-containing protein [Methylococcales bacterium]
MNNTLPSRADLPLFMQKQFEFTDCIRDPANKPLPEGIEARRMNAYQRVVYNNIEDLLAHNFPVIHDITSAEEWHAMVRDFVSNFRCHTPIFPVFGQEFVRYLQEGRDNPNDPPFLVELAHYEWVEMEIYLSEEEITLDSVDTEGDLLASQIALNPLLKRLAYHFPVHHISEDFLPDTPGDQVTCIVIFRRQNDDQTVGFMEVNPISDRLLAILQDNPELTGHAALSQIAEEMQHPNPDAVIAGGLEIL